MNTENTETKLQFFRYVLREYASLDFDGDYVSPTFPNPKLELITYDLIKETPKGYWIGFSDFGMFKKWVSKTAKKRYAYPTKEEAMINFVLRTKRRIELLKWQLDSCKIGLNLANYNFNNDSQNG